MTSFDDREHAYENKFAKDQEVEFKVKARRNRLVAEWVAEKIGLGGEKIREYALSFVEKMLGVEDEGALVAHLQTDIAQAGIEISETELLRYLREAEMKAAAQLAV